MRAEQRDLVALHARRLAASVPVLVERPDGVGAARRGSRGCVTIAAPRSQRVSTIALPSATSERSTESVRWARAMRPPAATCCEV